MIVVNPGVEEASAIAAKHGLTLKILRHRAKTAASVSARGAIIHALLARGWSTVRIGRLLNRDHTTISYVGRWYDADGRKRQQPIKSCIPVRKHDQGCLIDGCKNVVRFTSSDEEGLCPKHMDDVTKSVRAEWSAARKRLQSAWAVVDRLQERERALWAEATKGMRGGK